MRSTTLAVRERGQMTLPKALRDALDIEAGDTVKAVQIGDAIVLTPQRLDLDALRRQMQHLMRKHKVSADDLLSGL